MTREALLFALGDKERAEKLIRICKWLSKDTVDYALPENERKKFPYSRLLRYGIHGLTFDKIAEVVL